MRAIDTLIIHCTASDWGDVAAVDAWHKARGFKKIGYHILVLNGYATAQDWKAKKYRPELDGAIQLGRAIAEVGAHCEDYNATSIGVAFVGNAAPGPKVRRALFDISSYLMLKHRIPIKEIIGHREAQLRLEIPAAKRKTCPCFEVSEIRTELINSVAHWKALGWTGKLEGII